MRHPAGLAPEAAEALVPVAGLDAVTRRARGENFPVAAGFLPGPTRSHLLAVYGFARMVDDMGDEAPAGRLRLLEWMEEEVDAIFGGTPGHPLTRRLQATVRTFGIPPAPFRDLIQANRQDQTVTRYRTFDDLLRYCELSANPIGRMVLHVFEAATPRRLELSDRICTGLQLVEHWQDVGEDILRRDRIYLPLEDLSRFGCAEADLRAGRVTPAFRRLMAFEVGRARRLIEDGLPLARTLGLRHGLAVAGFAGGGLAALDAIGRAGFDVLHAPPRASKVRRMLTIGRTAATAGRCVG